MAGSFNTGKEGGDADPNSVNNVTVTPGLNYSITVPSGGFVTISWGDR